MQPETAFVNGRIWTGDPQHPWAESLCSIFGRIAVLDDMEAASRSRHLVDLQGRTVVPGFNDAHHHIALRGRRLATLDVSSEVAPSRQAVLERVAVAAADTPGDQWVRGGGFDNNKIGGFPTRQELDAASGGRKVLLSHVSEHIAVVSTAALEFAGVSLTNPPQIPGGEMPVDEDGAVSGLLLENAKKWFDGRLKPHSVEEMRSFLLAGTQAALAAGITSITDPGVGGIDGIGMGAADINAYQAARESGDLGVRVTAFPYITATHAVEALEPGADGWGIDLGIRTGMGDDMLRLGAVKVLTDGSLIGRTAALSCPYHDDDSTGMLTFEPEWLARTYAALHRSGWQIAAHAIGDRAVDNAVEHIGAAMAAYPRDDPRHRIEHCGLASDSAVRRIAELGIIPVPQGRFISELGDGFLRVLGAERSDRMVYRMRSFLDAGVELPGSSDTPVVEAHPLKGIHDMVNRRTAADQAFGLHERISVQQALRAYTYGSAFASHQEKVKGRLSPGMLADMAVLEADPFAADPVKLSEVRVVMTVLGGEVVYEV